MGNIQPPSGTHSLVPTGTDGTTFVYTKGTTKMTPRRGAVTCRPKGDLILFLQRVTHIYPPLKGQTCDPTKETDTCPHGGDFSTFVPTEGTVI